MKTVEHLCSQESQALQVKMTVVLLKERLNLWLCDRPANDTLYRLLLLKSMGVCVKDCSSKAFLGLNFLFSNLFFLKPN